MRIILLIMFFFTASVYADEQLYQVIDGEHGPYVLTESQKFVCGGSPEYQEEKMQEFISFLEKANIEYNNFANSWNPLRTLDRALLSTLLDLDIKQATELRVKFHNINGEKSGKVFVFEIHNSVSEKKITAFNKVQIDYKTTLSEVQEANEPHVFVAHEDPLCFIDSREETPIPSGNVVIDGEMKLIGIAETEDGNIP